MKYLDAYGVIKRERRGEVSRGREGETAVKTRQMYVDSIR